MNLSALLLHQFQGEKMNKAITMAAALVVVLGAFRCHGAGLLRLAVASVLRNGALKQPQGVLVASIIGYCRGGNRP